MEITASRLREVLKYDPETGNFSWLVKHSRTAHKQIAGALDASAYRVIRVDKKLYKAHRLAWLYVYGVWPKHNIDHINRIRWDNRIINLRDADQSTNMLNASISKNNKSGVKGVCWEHERQCWAASIKVCYKKIFLGRFGTKEEAIAARRKAEERLQQALKI
jgi:hypothetical protein